MLINKVKIGLVQSRGRIYINSAKKFSLHAGQNDKSIKWYWRTKEYDMFNNDVYKNYLIKRRDQEEKSKPGNFKFENEFSLKNLKKYLTLKPEKEPHVELLPLDESGNPSYNSCLIWLYDGDYIETFIEHLLEFNNFPPRNYKIVFYRAPVNPITHDRVVLERSWFNIFDLPDASGRRTINKKEIEGFNKSIQREIWDQYNLIGDYKKIYLGGFSQSACMAVYSTLTSKHILGGCVAFSGFNFEFTPLDTDKKSVPILAVNGIRDEVVLIKHARNSYSNLINLGFNLQFIEEPGLKHAFTKTGLRNANKLLESGNFKFLREASA
jgi:phospholipase/carboxylesterase